MSCCMWSVRVLCVEDLRFSDASGDASVPRAGFLLGGGRGGQSAVQQSREEIGCRSAMVARHLLWYFQDLVSVSSAPIVYCLTVSDCCMFCSALRSGKCCFGSSCNFLCC